MRHPQVITAVDLAARRSAAIRMDSNGFIGDQFDSSTCTEQQFVTHVCTRSDQDQLVVEDLPHGVEYRALVKRVCQLQGRIAHHAEQVGQLDKLLFVDPATWRRHYPTLRARGQGPHAVIATAREQGYQPPNLDHLRGPRGGSALTDKVTSDYCAAYLIARWALDTYDTAGTYDVPGTARYGQPTRRKAR